MFHSLFLDTYVFVETIRSLRDLKRRFVCVLNSPSAVRLQLKGKVPLDISTSNPLTCFGRQVQQLVPELREDLTVLN